MISIVHQGLGSWLHCWLHGLTSRFCDRPVLATCRAEAQSVRVGASSQAMRGESDEPDPCRQRRSRRRPGRRPGWRGRVRPVHPGGGASRDQACDPCCCRVLPLPADAVARAADQARIQAPFLYPKFGPAVVELAWRAIFKLQVWASTPFQCSNLVRQRTVVVDLLFPKMLPSASLSEGVVLVSLFKTGYQVWEVGH